MWMFWYFEDGNNIIYDLTYCSRTVADKYPGDFVYAPNDTSGYSKP